MALAILFFFLGLILLILEVFFPSFGVLSLSAAASFIASVAFAFGQSTGTGVAFIIVIVIVIPFALRFAFRMLPKTAVGRKFVLGKPPENRESIVTAPSAGTTGESVVGRVGTAATELRPAGLILLDGERLDAVTDGEYVERGTEVRVVRLEGNRIIVEATEAGSPAEGTQPQKPRWA